MTIGISDNALLRLLARGANLDLEAFRANLNASLARAHSAARSVTTGDYLIKADGIIYVVRGDTVTTVVDGDKEPIGRAATLEQRRQA